MTAAYVGGKPFAIQRHGLTGEQRLVATAAIGGAVHVRGRDAGGVVAVGADDVQGVQNGHGNSGGNLKACTW